MCKKPYLRPIPIMWVNYGVNYVLQNLLLFRNFPKYIKDFQILDTTTKICSMLLSQSLFLFFRIVNVLFKLFLRLEPMSEASIN